jgi:hypothetical protein
LALTLATTLGGMPTTIPQPHHLGASATQAIGMPVHPLDFAAQKIPRCRHLYLSYKSGIDPAQDEQISEKMGF